MTTPLRRSGLLIVAAALALTAATAANASRGAHRGVARHHRVHRPRAGRVHPVGFIQMPSMLGRRNTRDVAVASPASRGLRLSVDRSWGGSGVGSLGYQRLGASPLDVHDVNAAAGTQFGAPSAVVGGGVSYRF